MRAPTLTVPNGCSIEEVPRPEPGPARMLCRVGAISICGTDAHLVRGDYPGIWPSGYPFAPGHEGALPAPASIALHTAKRGRVRPGGTVVVMGPGERWGDAVRHPLVADGRIRVREIHAHTSPLDEFATALATFNERRDGALKVIVEP